MRGGVEAVAALVLCTSLFQNALGQGVKDSSFEQRLQMYSNWATDLQAKGRSLSTAYSPAEAPKSDGKFPPQGYGYCKVLRYATGFANTTLYFDKIIKDSPNFGECCKECNKDKDCKAWTRVAGGEAANFRNCYLKYNFGVTPRGHENRPNPGFDLSPNKFDNNHIGHPNDDKAYPELRYVNLGWQDPAFPVILESGTKDDVYPAEYYGCPYEPNAVSPCRPPPTCNFGPENKLVNPPCL